MIAFDLCCGKGHRFEGWFASSGDYDAQYVAGLVACPLCGDSSVQKALSVPNIGRKANQQQKAQQQKAQPQQATPAPDDTAPNTEMANVSVVPAEMAEMMQKLASAQTEMLKNSQWVGREFAEAARAIHYGESDSRTIHGEVSPAEADALADEGVAVAPLPFPFIPPEAKN